MLVNGIFIVICSGKIPSVLFVLNAAGIDCVSVKFCSTLEGIVWRVMELAVNAPDVGAFTVFELPVMRATLS